VGNANVGKLRIIVITGKYLFGASRYYFLLAFVIAAACPPPHNIPYGKAIPFDAQTAKSACLLIHNFKGRLCHV